jgi:hypothetical protein
LLLGGGEFGSFLIFWADSGSRLFFKSEQRHA